MILQLLKKDCIIAKNYVVAVILIGVGLPVLLVWRQPEMLEVFALPGAVFISSVAFNLAVSEKENGVSLADMVPCEDRRFARAEAALMLSRAAGGVSEKEMAAVWLVICRGVKQSDAGKLLRVSQSIVSRRVKSGLRKMRMCLEGGQI